MKRVLIFTDEDSWDGIDLDKDVKAQWSRLYPNGSRPVVKFDLKVDGPAQLDEGKVVDCQQAGVYLLFDGMKEKDFHTYTDSCRGEETVTLVHSHGRWTEPTIPVHLQAYCFKGTHTNLSDQELYCPIFRILADSDGNKMERILAFLFKGKLEKSINKFLAGCMKPYNGNLKFLEAKDFLINFPETSDLVREFYTEKYPNVTRKGENPQKSREDYKNELDAFSIALVSIVWH